MPPLPMQPRAPGKLIKVLLLDPQKNPGKKFNANSRNLTRETSYSQLLTQFHANFTQAHGTPNPRKS